MKRIVLTFFLCMITWLGFAETRRYYCEVKGIEKELGTGLKIIFDFGENASYTIWGSLSSKLKFVDKNGEIINFHSMVDAANYINPAKRNVLDLKNETCKNREKRNVLKNSRTRHFKTTKKQSKTGCFYSF